MKKTLLHCKPLLLTVALLLAVLCFAAPAYAATYEDTSGHWAETAIERWSSENVIQGFEGLFRPDDNITRGEMALIIDRIMVYQAAAENPFSDLEDTWYTEAVLKLNAQGIMLGYQDKVRPTDNITREEAVLMVARAVGMANMPAFTAAPYSDAASISSWAYDAVALFAERGYITDSPQYFRPQVPITRAELVVILDNLVGELWRYSGLYNEDVEGNAVIASEKHMFLNSDIYGDLIIAGGRTTRVILQNCNIYGNIINLSNADVTVIPPGEENDATMLFGSKELPVQQGADGNLLAGRDFWYDEDGRLTCTDGYYLPGIDVSEWQGEIDWEAVAADGIEFAFIRAGYRGYSEGQIFPDIRFHENMQGALEAGLKVGVYFYSQAISPQEAVEEAQFTLSMVQGYRLDYPIVYDWESAGVATARTANMDKETLTACAVAFCDTVERAGYTPCVYFYSKLAYELYDMDAIDEYVLWWAGYQEKPEFFYRYDIWQYTSSGKVAGIETNTDMNITLIPFR